MQKIYYCKHSLLVYVCPVICLFVPFLLHVTLQSDSYTIKRIATYMYMIFEILGIYVFFIKSFRVVLKKDKVSLNFCEFPIKEISLSEIIKIEKAKRIVVNMFALSKEQVSILYGDNQQLNVSLIKNEKFVSAMNYCIGNYSKHIEDREINDVKITKLVRCFLAIMYLTVNTILTLGAAGEWIYYPIVITAFGISNIICLFMYIKSFR